MQPEITVIMPILNGEKYMDEGIESILSQTFQNFELIVVNDGSTDRTSEKLSYFATRVDLKVIHHATRQGIARSVNDGIRNASGKYIAFLDHDDLWFPNFLEIQLAYLRAHPDTGMVHSDFQTIDPHGKVLEHSVERCRGHHRASGWVFRDLFMDSFIVGNSVLIRKDCFDRLGGFDETLRIGDYHMWMRIARNYKVDYTPMVLTKYRQHPAQDSGTFVDEDPYLDPVGLRAVRSILELFPEVEQELGKRPIRRRMALLQFDAAHASFSRRFVRNTRIHLSKAIRLWPWNLRFYLLYAGTLLQPSHVRIAKRVWHALQRIPVLFRKSRAGQQQVGISRN